MSLLLVFVNDYLTLYKNRDDLCLFALDHVFNNSLKNTIDISRREVTLWATLIVRH